MSWILGLCCCCCLAAPRSVYVTFKNVWCDGAFVLKSAGGISLSSSKQAFRHIIATCVLAFRAVRSLWNRIFAFRQQSNNMQSVQAYVCHWPGRISRFSAYVIHARTNALVHCIACEADAAIVTRCHCIYARKSQCIACNMTLYRMQNHKTVDR